MKAKLTKYFPNDHDENIGSRAAQRNSGLLWVRLGLRTVLRLGLDQTYEQPGPPSSCLASHSASSASSALKQNPRSPIPNQKI
jgi:hypothetical protein